jgi:ATP-binding cassette subfamily B protein
MVARGHLTIGGYAALAAAIRQFQSGLWMLVWDVALIDRDLRYVSDLFAYLDEPEEPAGGAPLPPAPLQQGITLEGVGFTYPGASRPVLDGVDLRLAPGERVAIVGRNGAGKTTLIRVLLGLYPPTTGRVLVDGVDLASADHLAWRRRATAIFQDFGHYHDTLRFNVTLGSAGDAEAAARLSGADAVADALPAGYDTVLTREFEEGEDLSTGQWQKIALARAYARNADVLVLDEPTAALDPRAEVEVYRQFRAATRRRAAILISHRLGSARLADRIIVLDGGRIVEEGTHDALIRQGGHYARLLEKQAAWYRDEG